MLKIDEFYVKRLKVPKGNPSPAPFAGRFPTRLFAQWTHVTEKEPIFRTYIGKPSEAVTRLLLRKRPDVHVFQFVEFDRKSKLISVGGKSGSVMLNKPLFTLYHPGVEPVAPLDSFLLTHFWLDGLPYPQKTPDAKFSFYVAQAQRAFASKLAEKVSMLLSGLSAEQLAQRETERELLRKKKAEYMKKMGFTSRYHNYGGGGF